MRADNDSEGGILALITHIRRRDAPGSRRTKLVLAALAVLGASLFFGPSMITLAICALSAGFILVFFASQELGTARVGRLVGPVMIVCFVGIALCGVFRIARQPGSLKALFPMHAVGFLVGHFAIAFFAQAAIVPAITSPETPYTNLGHFCRAPITGAWLFLVFPACILISEGQGALVLEDPARAIANPFFLLVPTGRGSPWRGWPRSRQ